MGPVGSRVTAGRNVGGQSSPKSRASPGAGESSPVVQHPLPNMHQALCCCKSRRSSITLCWSLCYGSHSI